MAATDAAAGVAASHARFRRWQCHFGTARGGAIKPRQGGAIGSGIYPCGADGVTSTRRPLSCRVPQQCIMHHAGLGTWHLLAEVRSAAKLQIKARVSLCCRHSSCCRNRLSRSWQRPPGYAVSHLHHVDASANYQDRVSYGRGLVLRSCMCIAGTAAADGRCRLAAWGPNLFELQARMRSFKLLPTVQDPKDLFSALPPTTTSYSPQMIVLD